MTIRSLAIIGLGLLGGSIGLAVKARGLAVTTTGWDRDSTVRARAAERGLVDTIAETAEAAVAGADLVILCVPVGAMADAARAIAPGLKPDAIVSDVGSSKAAVAEALTEALQKPTVAPKLLDLYTAQVSPITTELLEAKEALKAVVNGRGATLRGVL